MAPDFAACQTPLPRLAAAVGIALGVKVADALALTDAVDPIAIGPAAIKGRRLPVRGGGEWRETHGVIPGLGH
jgi:hypothetical protein